MLGAINDTEEPHNTSISVSGKIGTSTTAEYTYGRHFGAIGEVPFSNMFTAVIPMTALILIRVTKKCYIVIGEVIEGNVTVVGNVSSQDRDPNSICARMSCKVTRNRAMLFTFLCNCELSIS